jgi:hypothetical protein
LLVRTSVVFLREVQNEEEVAMEPAEVDDSSVSAVVVYIVLALEG